MLLFKSKQGLSIIGDIIMVIIIIIVASFLMTNFLYSVAAESGTSASAARLASAIASLKSGNKFDCIQVDRISADPNHFIVFGGGRTYHPKIYVLNDATAFRIVGETRIVQILNRSAVIREIRFDYPHTPDGYGVFTCCPADQDWTNPVSGKQICDTHCDETLILGMTRAISENMCVCLDRILGGSNTAANVHVFQNEGGIKLCT